MAKRLWKRHLQAVGHQPANLAPLSIWIFCKEFCRNHRTKDCNVRWSVFARTVRYMEVYVSLCGWACGWIWWVETKGTGGTGWRWFVYQWGAFYKAETHALAVDGAIRHSTQWRGPRALTSGGREEEMLRVPHLLNVSPLYKKWARFKSEYF